MNKQNYCLVALCFASVYVWRYDKHLLLVLITGVYD